MFAPVRFLAIFLAVSFLAAPLSAYAALPGSFGGKIIKSSPCISPLGPSVLVTLSSAVEGDLGRPKNYIITPGTIVQTPAVLPLPGGQALGIADIPYSCWNPLTSFFLFFSFSSVVTSFGQRVTLIGISPPG